MRVAIGSDHAGVALKSRLLLLPYRWLDMGTHTPDSVDYPDIANRLGEALLGKEADVGVLICGSGIGMSIAANRHKHIRGALCSCPLMAQLARRHNDANVLILGSRLIGDLVAEESLRTFLSTPFEGGRHQQRVDKL